MDASRDMTLSSMWVIVGVSHAGAALVVGPLLIVAPHSLAPALELPRARARADEVIRITEAEERLRARAKRPVR